MEDQDIILEDGEISHDSDDGDYTPLERPANYSTSLPMTRYPPAIQDTDSEEDIISSESDSDSDSGKPRNKKPKIKLKPKPQHNPIRKKYDIWSTRVQEDVLAETLNSCDVTIKDRSRAVESYDYKVGSEYYAELERRNNKRTREDRNNVNFRARKRSNSRDKKKGISRKILDLTASLNNNEDIAKDMANKLSEEKEDLILRVVDTLGKEKAIEIFEETKRIEEEGGMLIMNQTRRRTPGGVFLFLIRCDLQISEEQKKSIFNEEKEKFKRVLKRKNKKKYAQMKKETAEARAELLPDLLTRAELLAKQNDRTRKETDDRDVINPPPTPETDCHENSGDGMDSVNTETVTIVNGNLSDNARGKLHTYDDDFLDLGCSNDMDLF